MPCLWALGVCLFMVCGCVYTYASTCINGCAGICRHGWLCTHISACVHMCACLPVCMCVVKPSMPVCSGTDWGGGPIHWQEGASPGGPQPWVLCPSLLLPAQPSRTVATIHSSHHSSHQDWALGLSTGISRSCALALQMREGGREMGECRWHGTVGQAL